MRYKVRAADDDSFEELRQMLDDQKLLVLSSKRRRTLSTGSLPAETRKAIANRGGEVLEDRQYGPG